MTERINFTHTKSPKGESHKGALALLAHAEWRRRQIKSLLDFFKNRGRAPSESHCRNSETPFLYSYLKENN